MKPSPEPLRVPDRIVAQNFDRIADFLRMLASTPFADGVLLQDISVNGATSVPHRLGRLPRGWIELAPGGSARVYETRSERSATVLVLNAASAVTIDLWVY